MSSRPFKREQGQGYPPTARESLPYGAGDDEYEQRRFSGTSNDYTISMPYGARPPATTGSFVSYGYSTPTTSQENYPPQYGHANPQYSPYSHAYPTHSDARYRPPECQEDYSPSHPTTPAITYTHAPPLTTSSRDWYNTYGSQDSYESSGINSPAAGYSMTSPLVRTSSQRSDGERSQNSNDNKDRRFTCNRVINDDTECSAAFARKADLTRHVDCVHDKKPQFSCPVRNCSRKGDQGFTRRDHRTEHLRHFHHRDIPKRLRGNQNMDDEEDDEVTN